MDLRTTVSSSLFVLLTPLALGAQGATPGTEAAKPAPAKITCKIRTQPLTDAEAALAREEYATALDLFGKMSDSDPDASKAGVIRTLIEMDKVAEAAAQVDEWLALAPKDAWAVETKSEVLLRQANIAGAYETAQRAHMLAPCNPRVMLVEANVEALTANYAIAHRHIDFAHQVDSMDPDIRMSWVNELPRPLRLAAYSEILGEDKIISSEYKANAAKRLERLKQNDKPECTVVRHVETATIPIKPIMNGPLYVAGLAVDVQFNGKRRRLELDTGASGLLLSRSAAAGLGLIREDKFKTGGIGDDHIKVDTSSAHVESVRIGDLEFQNCEVDILEKGSALDIDGLIGGDVFAKYLLTIDYPRMQLRVDPLPKRPTETVASDINTEGDDPDHPRFFDRYIAPEMQDWTKIYRAGHDLLLPVIMADKKNNVSGKTRLFIVDTGSDSMLISPQAARDVTKVHRDDSMGIRGISGEVKKVYSTDTFTFGFAHLKQTVDQMTSIDTTRESHSVGAEVSGFMGAPVLQRLAIHIDYRDNLIKFDYDPKHDGPGTIR